MESYEKKTTIVHIHESILILILCYLPVDSIIRCRSVCKNWATLLFSQYFQESYSLSATRPLQFLLNGTVGRATEYHKHLFFAHLDQASCVARSNCALPVITKFVLPGFESSSHILKICSTCNFTGFIVVYAYPGEWDEFGHPYYIFNPITGQHYVVQQNSTGIFWRNCALLFPHKTNKLKLLRAFPPLGTECDVEIQTIGTDSWRTLRESSSLNYNQNFGFPCYLNGIYHWPCFIRGKIVCFNPDEEVFYNIASPSFTNISCYMASLGILDGCLAFVRRRDEDLEFWMMNEYGVSESWIKKFVISNNEIISSLTDPLRFLKYGETVVLCDEYNDYNAICYNPSTGNCKFITYYIKSDPNFWYVPIPYCPNITRFVSG